MRSLKPRQKSHVSIFYQHFIRWNLSVTPIPVKFYLIQKTRKTSTRRLTDHFPKTDVFTNLFFWTHELRTRFFSDPRNTHENFFRTHELPTRIFFRPTNYARDFFSDPRTTHEGTNARGARDARNPRKARGHDPRGHVTHVIYHTN